MKELCDIGCGTPEEAIMTLCETIGQNYGAPDSSMIGAAGSMSPPLIIFTGVTNRRGGDHTRVFEPTPANSPFYMAPPVKDVEYTPNFIKYVKDNDLGTITDGPEVQNPITHNTVKLFTWVPNYPKVRQWWIDNHEKFNVERAASSDVSPMPNHYGHITVRDKSRGTTIPAAEVQARAEAVAVQAQPEAPFQPQQDTTYGSIDRATTPWWSSLGIPAGERRVATQTFVGVDRRAVSRPSRPVARRRTTTRTRSILRPFGR